MTAAANWPAWISQGWVLTAVYLAAGIIVALVLRLVLSRLELTAERTKWRLDDLVVNLLRFVLPWSAAITGIWLAVLSLPLSDQWRADADHVLLAVLVLIITIGLAKASGALIRTGALAHAGTSGSATIFVNITRVAVLTIGILVLLSSLGVAITPLITALGVGGLAVALALQDTLTNLFAGVHILASGKVQPGDFIQLDNGMQGYVEDTNWRNTIIRQLPNNLLIVPNATLASSIVTNFQRPQPEMSVIVQVGVGYESDLEHVERVTIEVGREVMQTVDGGVTTHEPSIRYHTFGDSSIDFSVILRATENVAQYIIVHEFIKRLHRRYRAENINIPFPIRTIMHAPAADPAADPAPALDGAQAR